MRLSLQIKTNEITQVLLTDGWHKVWETSFEIDAYELVTVTPDGKDAEMVFQGGQEQLIPATGFRFKEYFKDEFDEDVVEGSYISGPLTSILAVKEQPE